MSMEFYTSKKNTDYIAHWAFGKQSDDHKYVARVVVGKNSDGTHKYRYFYSMKEYSAYIDQQSDRQYAKDYNKASNNARKIVKNYNESHPDSEMTGDFNDQSTTAYSKTSKEMSNSDKHDYNKASDEFFNQYNKTVRNYDRRNNVKKAIEKREQIATKLDESHKTSTKIKRKIRRTAKKTLATAKQSIKNGKQIISSLLNK